MSRKNSLPRQSGADTFRKPNTDWEYMSDQALIEA
jgi:hypothetical protein